ncbi:hypothetical protein KW801_01200 [Candidatus Saccharibacteria bacterium]|nr:hypothetical protein [Candidatus Saccharibacteria bacterium]
MAKADKYKTYFNPAGFVEQQFIGTQTPESVLASVEDLIKWSKKLKSKQQPALFLVDVTQVPKIDISSKMAHVRQRAVKAMTSAEYDRVAIYGNVAVQILVNTLVLIAGKRHKIRVFSNRVDALSWLKETA